MISIILLVSMCGIAGKIIFNSQNIVEQDLRLMSLSIKHRGPDDEGIYVSPNKKIGLVSRRLAIIDLSKKGHMPMHYKDRYTITYNGEIYNFQILKAELEKEGYQFSSKTDTEVILALYDKYKEKCLEHLRGMFAFALFDKIDGTLFLVRDRLGKKPLKYFYKDGVFIFASELKAILTQKEVEREPDWQAIYEYLTFGYVQAPRTGFQNIQKLEPGHFLLLSTKTGDIKKVRYWKPDYSHKRRLSGDEWSKRIITSLEESTKLRMIADVPVGAFLSGGVDSSAVVAMMAKHSKKKVKTFTIGYKEKSHDERQYAKQISSLFDTDHTELVANPENIEDLLPFLAEQYEEPYANSSNVVTYLVSKMAREHVTVVLNGDGGDENFAGYDRYIRLARDARFDKTGPLKKIMYYFFRDAVRYSPDPRFKQMLAFLEKAQTSLPSRFLSYNQYFDENEVNKNNGHPDSISGSSRYITPSAQIESIFKESKAHDPRDQALYYDLTHYLPEDLLVKVDIASMANSLEARSPLLDHTFVELACSIPFDLKVKNGIQLKYIFKKSLEPIIPSEVLYRPKMGFSIPLSSWFTGKTNEYAKSVLMRKNGFAQSILGKNTIEEMLAGHTEGKDFGPRLWALLTLELWHKAYF